MDPLSRQPSRLRAGTALGLVLLTVLAVALRAHGLGRRCFWLDEVMAASCVSGSLPTVIRCVQNDIDDSPVLFVLTWAWYRLGGEPPLPTADWFLRAPNVLVGALAVPLAWALARRLLGRRAAWVHAGLWTVAPLAVGMSQQFRPQMALVLVWLASSILLVRALRRPRILSWVAVGLGIAFLVYTNYIGLLAIAGQALVIAVVLGGRAARLLRRPRTGPRAWRFLRLRATGALVAAAVASIAVLPWLPHLLRFLTQRETAAYLQSALSLRYADALAQWFVFGDLGTWKIWLYPVDPIRGATLAALGLAGAIWMARKKPIALTYCLCTLAGPAVYLISPGSLPATPRYLLPLQVPVYLLLSAGAAVGFGILDRGLRRWSPSLAPRGVTVGVGAVLGIAALTPGLVDVYEARYFDWRGVTDYVRSRAREGDVVLTYGANAVFLQWPLSYYLSAPPALPVIGGDDPRAQAASDRLHALRGRVWGVVPEEVFAPVAESPPFRAVEFRGAAVLPPTTTGEAGTLAENAVRFFETHRSLDPPMADLWLALLEPERRGENLLDPARLSQGLPGWEAHPSRPEVLQENGNTVLSLQGVEGEPRWVGRRLALDSDSFYLLAFGCRNGNASEAANVLVRFVPAGAGEDILEASYSCPPGGVWYPGRILFRTPDRPGPTDTTVFLTNAGSGSVDFRSLWLVRVGPAEP